MKNIIIFFVLILAFSTCKDNEVDTCGCEGPINCTLDYRYIVVEITDINGKPYVLDEYKTTRIEDGLEIFIKSDEYTPGRQSLGMYLLMGDGHKSLTDKCGKAFRFTGRKDGKEVISRDYLIAHDCCHIMVKEGDTKITIN